MKNQCVLENAMIIGTTLFGNVYGKDTFDDGAYVKTSKVLGYVREIEIGDVVETIGSKYLIKSLYRGV